MYQQAKEEMRVRTLQGLYDIAAVTGGVRKLCKEFGI